jgi:hypothetical protein
MPLKFFGPNRMAAQQGVEDSGSSLVRQRPSWGMGPQNMPGSFDYNPSATESSRGGQGGPVERAPNAYERGGFFWNGSGISQGTPIAHQDQRMRLAENEDVRRYAQQALDDKKHNLNVRDVDSRIRMADRSFDENVRQGDRRFGLDERKLGEDVRIADRSFGMDVRKHDLNERVSGANVQLAQEAGMRDSQRLDSDIGYRRHGMKLADQANDLNERKFGADVRIADRGFNENVRQADRQWGVVENQDKRAAETHGERWKVREHELGVKEMQRREKGAASSNPEQFLAFFDKASGGKAYADGFGAMNGKPNVSLEATKYLNSVDELAMHPRMKDVPMQTIAQLAFLNAQVDTAGNVEVTDPKTGKRGIYEIPSMATP